MPYNNQVICCFDATRKACEVVAIGRADVIHSGQFRSSVIVTPTRYDFVVSWLGFISECFRLKLIPKWPKVKWRLGFANIKHVVVHLISIKCSK